MPIVINDGVIASKIWKTKPPIDYIDTTLTINDFETVSADLSGGKPAKIWIIYVEQTNNGATAEDIELEITLNGTAYTWSGTLNSGDIYYGAITMNLTTGDFTPYFSTTARAAGNPNANYAIPLTAESIGLIRVRQTSTVDGTAAQIEVNIAYEILEED